MHQSDRTRGPVKEGGGKEGVAYLEDDVSKDMKGNCLQSGHGS